METGLSFKQELYQAVEAKQNWYDTSELQSILTDYRTMHSVVDNLINMLIKKGLIQPDPYKLDKKISDLAVPEDGQFIESERSMVIGARLSDYESMLDFICNIFKFSVNNLGVEQIKILLALNNYFQWNAIVPTAQKANTRGLAEIVQSVKHGGDQLSTGMINDCITQASKTVASINAKLKELTDFQRELYKIEVRKNILEHPSYQNKEFSSPQEAFSAIKKAFPQFMGKKPFYTELIEELAQEEYGPKKAELQQQLLKKLEITQKKESEKKKASINTKEMLFDAFRCLSGVSPFLETISAKIDENYKVLESEHQGFWDKFLKLLRQAFNRPEKPVEFHLTVVESLTQSKRTEILDYNKFITDLRKKIRIYNSLSSRKSMAYTKLESQSEQAIFEYLSKQLSECQHILVLLTALDDYFKTAPTPANRMKIKGLKMELTSLKNTLVKTNQRKAEYTSFVEEEEQLKKLGIKNV